VDREEGVGEEEEEGREEGEEAPKVMFKLRKFFFRDPERPLAERE
jgi:hypothetical protein